MDTLSLTPHLSRLKLTLSPPSAPPTFLSPHPLLLRHHYRSLTFSLLALQPQQQSPPPTTSYDSYNEDESYGDVNRIIGSRVSPTSPTTMEYLIEWKDDHAPTWVPSNYIASDVVADYETPWWTAAKKADASELERSLAQPDWEARDVDAVDSDGRTALHFVSGIGSDTCVSLLTTYGADVNKKDVSGGGLTPLHMAAGYARSSKRALIPRLKTIGDLQRWI